MNIVDTFLVEMIKRWPTLRETRNDALYDLCVKTTQYDDEIEWDASGNIVFSPNNTGEFFQGVNKSLEEMEAELHAKRDLKNREPGSVSYNVAEQMLASDILFQRREHAKKQFVFENAELIVQSHDNKFGTTLPDGGAFRFLKSIPEHANPLWVEAFVELAQDILHFKYPQSKFENMTSDYADRYQTNLDKAKQNAQAFLIMVNGTNTEKRDLAKNTIEVELEKLRKKAADAGLKLEVTIA